MHRGMRGGGGLGGGRIINTKVAIVRRRIRGSG